MGGTTIPYYTTDNPFSTQQTQESRIVDTQHTIRDIFIALMIVI